jgi:hypothetical protein
MFVLLLSIFSCLNFADNLIMYDWQHYDYGIEVTGLPDIQGSNIWAGYDNGGWNAPDNIEGMYKIVGTLGNDLIEVWIWGNDDNYYVFPFNNTDVYSVNGHFGMHPCGGYEVDKRRLQFNFGNLVITK